MGCDRTLAVHPAEELFALKQPGVLARCFGFFARDWGREDLASPGRRSDAAAQGVEQTVGHRDHDQRQ